MNDKQKIAVLTSSLLQNKSAVCICGGDAAAVRLLVQDGMKPKIIYNMRCKVCYRMFKTIEVKP